MTCRACDKSLREPLGLGTAARALPSSIGKERAEELCGARTFSSHPSCWLPPSPAAAQGPESPETSVFWGQEQAFLLAPCLTQPGVPAIGTTGVSVSACPCPYTAPCDHHRVEDTMYMAGFSCPEDAGWGTGMVSLGRLCAILPECDKAAATISVLAVVGCFCFGSNQLCFHAAFRTKSKKSICWGFFFFSSLTS